MTKATSKNETITRIRFAVVSALDRRARSVCWSDAVSWALGQDEELTLLGLLGTAKRRGCASECGCYCGKWKGDNKHV